mmetsp:Transcript_38850/g.120852  ORF Transcript_38850/g.120852 Transcript_38850/m.120852 type:complete len:396 (-) Transcript_38850:1200-2387(-)
MTLAMRLACLPSWCVPRLSLNSLRSSSSSARIGRTRSLSPPLVVHSCTYCVGYGRMAGFGRDALSVLRSCSTTRASRERIRSADDPGLLHDNLAEAHHQLLHLRQVHLTPATDASQRRVDLRLLHHAAGERGRQRRQAERAVLVNLDQGAALAEEEYRSELLVHAAPDDDLVAAHPLHRLDADAVEVLRAGLLADAGLDSAEALADGVGIGDVEQHPADVGLVRYGLAVDLEHDGVAHPLGNSHGLVCRLGDLDRRHWDVVGRQHLLGLGLRQDSTLLSQGTLYDGPDALSVGSVLVVVFGQVRGLVKCLQAVLVTPHVVEQPHCGIRVVKRGDVRPVEDLLASPDCHAPHPACEQGLAAQVCVALELLRGHRWVCHVLWSQDDQQSVTVLVGGG